VGSTINLNAPLTPFYSYPVATLKIGNILSATSTAVAVSASTAVSLVQLEVPAGEYVLTADASAGGQTNFTKLGFETTNSFTGALGVNSSSNNNAQPYFGNSCISVSNAVSTIYYVVFLSSTGFTITNATIKALRIA
jgi:hypothetical protein